MYKQKKPSKTSLNINNSYEGESIEEKISRIVNNKEPITDGAPLIYQEREDGVQAQYDIRTDRFEIAIDAMDKVTGSHQAKREQRIGEKTYDTMSDDKQKEFNTKYPNNKHAQKAGKDGGAEPLQGTK